MEKSRREAGSHPQALLRKEEKAAAVKRGGRSETPLGTSGV